jgi:hypothetical protein
VVRNPLQTLVLSLTCLSLVLSNVACGTSDKARLKESRDAYLADDYAKSETALYTPEVFANEQNRLLHYYLLSSLAMSEAQYEKAAYYLNKARDAANAARSSSGMFEWFSSDYRSNPIEYSYIHYMLVMAYSLLAEEGQTKAWSTPDIKDKKGNVLVQSQNFPERKFSPREIADFRQKARAELRAWDTHLEDLKRTYPNSDYYKEDLWARMLASFIHASSGQNSEKRTAELLTNDADRIFGTEFNKYPSKKTDSAEISSLIAKLRKRAQGKDDHSTLFILEAGVMSQYKIKRFHLGLTTLFGQIKDPYLRSMIEQIGMNVIINTAPEFGLILLAGGVAGAIGGNDDEFDGPPQFFTDAVDRSFGFEIRFPTMQLPPDDTKVRLQLLGMKDGKALAEQQLPIVSPLQEMVAIELKEREQKDMFARAVRIGLQYVGILIPAIKAYKDADRNGNAFGKIAVIAGYYISKKIIDNANNPDLRSWNYLPKIIATDVLDVKPGDYDAKVTIDNSFGKYEKSLGKVTLGNQVYPILLKHIGSVPILDKTTSTSAVPLR